MKCTQPKRLDHGWVLCGRCPACKLKRVQLWSLRLLHHSEQYEDSVFLTLTYSPENLIIRTGSKVPMLSKTDLQKFLKRLRIILYRNHRNSEISYYGCGEYGDRTGRPHYHILIFGIGVLEAEFIKQAWDLGLVDIGSVTPASIRYVSSYIDKKVLGPRQAFMGREPEFQLASNKIGADWISDNMEKLLYNAALVFQGKNYPLPRYYLQKLRALFPDAADGVAIRIALQADLQETEDILAMCPEFGGRSYDQLTYDERAQLTLKLSARNDAMSADISAGIKFNSLTKEKL